MNRLICGFKTNTLKLANARFIPLFFILALFVSSEVYSAPWTDDPLAPGDRIKAVHVNEIKSQLDLKYASFGMALYPWSPEMQNITAGTTRIRASHINELRAALQMLYTSQGMGPIGGSDVTATSAIRAVDIVVLRQDFDAV